MFAQLTKLKTRTTVALTHTIADFKKRFWRWAWCGEHVVWEGSQQKLEAFQRHEVNSALTLRVLEDDEAAAPSG